MEQAEAWNQFLQETPHAYTHTIRRVFHGSSLPHIITSMHAPLAYIPPSMHASIHACIECELRHASCFVSREKIARATRTQTMIIARTSSFFLGACTYIDTAGEAAQSARKLHRLIVSSSPPSITSGTSRLLSVCVALTRNPTMAPLAPMSRTTAIVTAGEGMVAAPTSLNSSSRLGKNQARLRFAVCARCLVGEQVGR